MDGTRRRLVVVGNGMVAAAFLEELVAGSDGFEVTVFGAEPHPAYDRIKLSSVLAGQCEPESLTMLDEDWYVAHGVTLRAGHVWPMDF